VDQKAHHRLLLDRRERVFYAGHAQDVRRFMEAAQSDLKKGAVQLPRRRVSESAVESRIEDGKRQRMACGGLAQLMWDEDDYLRFLKMWMSEHL